MRGVQWKRVILVWTVRLMLLAAGTAALAALLCYLLGWQGKRGISDALFLIGIGEILVAGITVWGSSVDSGGAATTQLWSEMRENVDNVTMNDLFYNQLLSRQGTIYGTLAVGVITLFAAALALL